MTLGELHYFPEISHFEFIKDAWIYVMTNGRCGALFDIPGIDLESNDAREHYQVFQQLLSGLPEELEIKLEHQAINSCLLSKETFRRQALEETGFTRRRLLLSIEQKLSDPLGLKALGSILKGVRSQLAQESKNFFELLPQSLLASLGARSLSRDEINEILSLPDSSVGKGIGRIDLGSEVLGVIRLYRQGMQPMDEKTLAALTQSLPKPFRLVVSASKVTKTQTDIGLRSLLNRQTLMDDPTQGHRIRQTAEAIRATSLDGASLLKVEWLLVLSRRSEESLRQDLENALSSLRSFGEVMIETVGAVNSYLASRFGNPQHFTFLELDAVAPYFFPIASYGEANRMVSALESRSLVVHREDKSLHFFDLFNPEFLASNLIISGKSGSGKSVFGNLLSSSLLLDPKIRLTKIDVGGSYKKECEILGGRMVELSLNRPSGVNPFKYLNLFSFSHEAVATLVEFLCVLVQEDQETRVPRMMQAAIETGLKQYCEKVAKTNADPSLDSFLKEINNLPRRELLQRWATGGIYENALKESEFGELSDPKYIYYNFENIQGAADPEFALGIMAAVIAHVNLQMLEIVESRTSEERFVLFCDEMKFFIERNADFFLLTTANFRKFGHSVILMTQNIRDFEIKRGGGELDLGIILNSPLRVFFETHLSEEYLRQEFRFNDREIRTVLSPSLDRQRLRFAILQDDLGTRRVGIELTHRELWRVTSRREHLLKYEKLRSSVPELTAEEAIQVLSIGSQR